MYVNIMITKNKEDEYNFNLNTDIINKPGCRKQQIRMFYKEAVRTEIKTGRGSPTICHLCCLLNAHGHQLWPCSDGQLT